MASPSATTTYTLTIVGDDFTYYSTDAVEVNVGTLNNITISPKCCYKANDVLKPEMINIVTDPPGYESFVTFNPPNVPTSALLATYQSSIMVEATCGVSGTPIQMPLTLDVINENIATQVGVGIPSIAEFNWASVITKIVQNLEKIEKVMQGLPVPTPCPFKLTHSLAANYKTSYMCCPSASPSCQKEKYKITVQYKPCYSTSCDFFFYGVPYVAALNLRVIAGACVVFSGAYNTGCDEGQFCLGASGELTLGGGISATILGGSVINSALLLVAKGTTPSLQICFPSNDVTSTGPLCVDLKVTGDVTLISLVKFSVERSLLRQYCL
jgi:hypothetical protein